MPQLIKCLNSPRRFRYCTTLHHIYQLTHKHFFPMKLFGFDLLPDILHLICNISWNYTHNQNIINIRARLLYRELNIFCNNSSKWHANSVAFNTLSLFLFPKFPIPVITFFYCINETWPLFWDFIKLRCIRSYVSRRNRLRFELKFTSQELYKSQR
jgi:hypothetical protein